MLTRGQGQNIDVSIESDQIRHESGCVPVIVHNGIVLRNCPSSQRKHWQRNAPMHDDDFFWFVCFSSEIESNFDEINNRGLKKIQQHSRSTSSTSVLSPKPLYLLLTCCLPIVTSAVADSLHKIEFHDIKYPHDRSPHTPRALHDLPALTFRKRGTVPLPSQRRPPDDGIICHFAGASLTPRD